MKYLFVIYTDSKYKQHLDYFKSQKFYRDISSDSNIEVIEWGGDYHTDYQDLPSKTQKMMKWCGENKDYDYLIKCDDTIFNDTWDFYKSKMTYKNLFENERDGFCYSFDRWDKRVWRKVGEYNNEHYWGIHYLEPLSKEIWDIYFEGHYKDKFQYDMSVIKTDIPFYEGKFYMVSKDFSIFIGEQENLAKTLCKKFPVEDLMVGYLAQGF